MKIYLASKSPRRRELLDLMGVDYELLLVDTPEIVAPNESPYDYSQRVTKEKLEAAWDKIIETKAPIMPILCADTEVVLDHIIQGKPDDYQAAFAMLHSFSGRAHEVITSVGVKYHDFEKIVMDKTIVTMAFMTDENIKTYLDTGNYIGKSGSYGIQSYLGQFVARIDGCFYSVMGLPLNTVRLLLQEIPEPK